MRAAKHELEAVLVMHQEPAAREVLLGLTQDRRFGPLVAFGLGGIYTEVLRDVVFHLAPLTDEDAKRMVRSIRAFPLLEGTRGQPSADLEALEDALMRLSRLAVDHPEIAEMELNPFFVRDAGQGAVAIDARVRVQR
ncbi:MAG: acetate--CoA ligase family protein [Euryarchaeota archaeon]|nr:acetate--CoA ligase family protein [Euryarchaeota archaeon]